LFFSSGEDQLRAFKMTIKIVTDSTSDLPDKVIRDLGITVVPLFINLFDKGYLDGVEITRQDFYTNLPNYAVYPTTGIPGVNAFTQVYEELASNGAKEILSIHISESLSGTVDVAQTAAREFEQIPVTVRDSGQLSLGTGFQVETAARMAFEGKSMVEIEAVVDDLELGRDLVEITQSVVGDFSKPNTVLIFITPLIEIYGLNKEDRR
jgi:DegV family protein with EDD domain